MNGRFIVIGGDAAGMSAASRAKRRAPDMDVQVFEMTEWVSYAACGIPYYVEGLVPELSGLQVVTPESFRQKRGIKLELNHEVKKIDPVKKVVTVLNLDSGKEFQEFYDSLLISTGAKPIILPSMDPLPEGVFPVRGLPEAGALKNFIDEHKPREAAVVGGGYIGIEMVEALSEQGMEVTVVQSRDRLMPAMEEEISALVEQEIERHEVRVIKGVGAQKITEKGGRLEVALENGESLSAGVVVLGMGVSPNSGLAKDAGIELGVRGAIRVDRRQRTSAPGVYAAGDCAEAYHRISRRNAYVPLALTANRQGRVVGSNVAGINEEFPGILGSAVTKTFDLAVARTGLGLQEAKDIGLEVVKVEFEASSRAHYYPGAEKIKMVIMVEPGGKRFYGVQMAGADGVAHRINCWAAALGAGLDLQQVHELDLAYAPPFSPAWDPVLTAADVAMKKAR